MRIATLILAACASVATQPQTIRPKADAPPSAERPAEIHGRVIAADDGRPLRRARIALLSAANPGRPLMTTSTNAQGNYDLRDVAPGSYFVSASRPGYIEQQYGQRRARERGLAVDVKAGQTITRIDVALVRGAVIAGRITDENGEPYQGLTVTSWQTRYQEGRRARFPSGTGQTDDQGAYRISGLQPGSYFLSAVSPETWRNTKNETFGYAATYYPGASFDNAQPIVLDSGQQRLSVDLSLAAGRTSRLKGRIIRETGEPAAAVPVTANPSIRGTGLTIFSGNPISSTTSADGSFELPDVPPGFYEIRSIAGGEARVAVEVTGDLDNLLLVSRSGSTVSGVVITDSGEPPPFNVAGARLSLVAPAGDVLPTVRVPAIESDWTFTLRSMGGPFLFRLSGFPNDWMLDAVRLGDDDVTDTPFDVPTGGKQIAGLRIVITKDVGTIAGSVMTEKGAASADAIVVVFSEDERHWIYGSRFIRTARPTSAGTYSISGLPAGDYLVVAERDLMEGEWDDPQYLKAAVAKATKVTLKRGGSETVDLKLR